MQPTPPPITTLPHPYHLADIALQDFSNAELDALVNHIVTCDNCLTAFDKDWESKEIGVVRQGLEESLNLNYNNKKIVEERLVKQIRYSQLGNDAIRMATAGLLDVLIALLRPFLIRR
ncbi:MAG TPA: hypothetical protein PK299_03075 [Anaerolineales bacterium]|nr:hypothetical protein [Anaerolineales bacterium]